MLECILSNGNGGLFTGPRDESLLFEFWAVYIKHGFVAGISVVLQISFWRRWTTLRPWERRQTNLHLVIQPKSWHPRRSKAACQGAGREERKASLKDVLQDSAAVLSAKNAVSNGKDQNKFMFTNS
ncbi:hypothetical protein HPP92_011763 [Vanilla planifolia]|uniref:Uncharacterized protein n=1 Tax=Vanilla planifolia TaxID=51239 RepID=A0A835R3E5_VANPL|nr:hypothetical protein HPP92_012106 [Vanilla planifolia]KAG0483679.1 hypothetical protein HPP92_011763 [Vanilla planifolia]